MAQFEENLSVIIRWLHKNCYNVHHPSSYFITISDNDMIVFMPSRILGGLPPKNTPLKCWYWCSSTPLFPPSSFIAFANLLSSLTANEATLRHAHAMPENWVTSPPSLEWGHYRVSNKDVLHTLVDGAVTVWQQKNNSMTFEPSWMLLAIYLITLIWREPPGPQEPPGAKK